VKRHPALVPLSHDHHPALVEARRLRQHGPAAAREFLRFFGSETTRHFREEEELVFPLLYGDEPEQLREVLLQHQRLRALAGRLRGGEDVSAELADLLEAHIRLEERDLFELIQRRVPEDQLASIGLAPREPEPPVADLAAGGGRGPLWGTAADDLNATLLAWDPDEGPEEHVNEHRDVLYVLVEGGGTLVLDGEERSVRAPAAFVVEKGRRRRLVAGPGGIRYLTAHLRRPPLQIRPAS
jgi:mannose-6-phosphate isomerase-like protein (cupin superfamily)